MRDDKKFNVRVYGLLVWENQVLVVDEWLPGAKVTKFPGGGLEWGEGTAQCLQREFREELELDIIPGELFYINDFFQPSAFNPHHQVLSIYCQVHTPDAQNIAVKQKPFDFEGKTQGAIVSRWVRLNKLEPQQFYFPIDKMVARLLFENCWKAR